MTAKDLKILLGVVMLMGLPMGFAVVMSFLRGTLVVQNETPGARIENLRWVGPDGDMVGGAGSLLPGESTSLDLGYWKTDVPGTLSFELVVEGSRVLLNTKDKFRAPSRSEVRVGIDPKLRVTTPLTLDTPPRSESP